MARTSVADSATSQFFINVVDNGGLDLPRDGAAYAVFGRVIGGMDVVDAIRNVKTGIKGGMRDVPVEDVMITKASMLTADEAKAAAAAKPAAPTTPAAPAK
jgi:cyclophilin family peptidyl-prolyl cis-trans isomerase